MAGVICAQGSRVRVRSESGEGWRAAAGCARYHACTKGYVIFAQARECVTNQGAALGCVQCHWALRQAC